MHLLRHHQPPGSGEGDRAALRCPAGGRPPQPLQRSAVGRGGPPRRLRAGAPGAARRRHLLVEAGRHLEPRHHRRRLGAVSPGGGGRGRVPRALRGEGGERERRRRKRRLQAPQGTDGQGGHRLTGPRRTASATPPPPRPQAFFMAVYTEVSAEDIESFVAEYGLGEVLSFKGIAEGVENSNYLLQTETGTYILTLYDKRVAACDLPCFLGLMEHLAERGISF